MADDCSLLVFSRDPGATRTLLAVLDGLAAVPQAGEPDGLQQLRGDAEPYRRQLRIVARPPGEAIWRRAGHAVAHWSGREPAEADDLLRAVSAGMVLTGTSDVDDPGDRLLWQAARERGIASHAVLDQKVNLAARFRTSKGATIAPDWVYVRDADYAAELAETGIGPRQIRVIGDVAMRWMQRRHQALTNDDAIALRAAWKVPPDTPVILFVSECGREMAVAGRIAAYDEVAVLEGFLQRLDRNDRDLAVPGRNGQRPHVVIRPHPRDGAGKYAGFKSQRPSGVTLCVSTTGEPEAALKAADLVVGMNSSLLHEARALGVPALSLTGHPLADAQGAQW